MGKITNLGLSLTHRRSSTRSKGNNKQPRKLRGCLFIRADLTCLECQPSLEHRHGRAAYLHRLNLLARTDDFHIRLTGTVHPMSLLGDKGRTLDQPIMPEISRHASRG